MPKYDKYYQRAAEILAHHKAGDSSPEWMEEYEKIFPLSTTLSASEQEKIADFLKGRDVESFTPEEKCLILAYCGGLKFEESVKLRHSNFIMQNYEEDLLTYIDIKGAGKQVGRKVPISVFAYLIATGIPGRNRKEEDVYVVGLKKKPIKAADIADKVYDVFVKIGLLNEDVMTALAVSILDEKERLGDKAIDESDLVEYLLRRTFATNCAAEGCTAEQVMYFLGVEE